MGNVETIIWDLDGTLLDSFGVFQEVLADILPKYGYEIPTKEMLIQNFHGNLEDSISNVLGKMSKRQLDKIVTDFLQVQNTHYVVVEHHIFPDALELAKKAEQKGVTQVLITNRDHNGRLNASPINIIASSSLNGLITEIRCGDDSVHRKPNREVVEDLLATGKIDPRTTLVIGDQFVDGEFAMNLGSRGILVNRSGGEFPHLERLGDNYTEFLTIVPTLATVEL